MTTPSAWYMSRDPSVFLLAPSLPFSQYIVPYHSFRLQLEVHGSFFLRYIFQLATPQGFHVAYIPKGNLVLRVLYYV